MQDISRIPIVELQGNLLVSLQGELSDRLVAQIKDDVTNRIARTRVDGLVIDVSGIEIMDSYISRSILDVGMMAKLMGVNTVISGMDPMIAMTLVEMGLDFSGVMTELNLDTAVERLQRARRKRFARERARGKGRGKVMGGG